MLVLMWLWFSADFFKAILLWPNPEQKGKSRVWQKVPCKLQWRAGSEGSSGARQTLFSHVHFNLLPNSKLGRQRFILFQDNDSYWQFIWTEGIWRGIFCFHSRHADAYLWCIWSWGPWVQFVFWLHASCCVDSLCDREESKRAGTLPARLR